MWLYMYNLKKKLFLKCNVYNNKPRPNYLEFYIITVVKLAPLFFSAPHSSRMIEIPAGCGILKVCLIYSRAESCANGS